MPIVSVILPVFNGEKYIYESVSSILSQTLKDFNLYVLNDGSNDKTLDILESIKDPRIIIINNNKNLGLINTLNIGLRLGENSKYVARMDADDIAFPNRLMKQVDFLDKNNNVGLLGSASMFFNDKKIIKKHYQPVDHNNIMGTFFCQNPMSHPTVMIRSDCIHDLEYDCSFPKYEDYALWIEMIGRCDFYNLTDFLLKYRRHNLNITNTYKANVKLDINIYRNLLIKMFNKMEVDFIEEDLHILSIISNRVRYEYDKNIPLSILMNFQNRLIKKKRINKVSAYYINILLNGLIAKYLFYNKRYYDFSMLLLKINPINLRKAILSQVHGAVMN